MRLPGGETAIVDVQKLTGYCLNPEHPRSASRLKNAHELRVRS